MTEHEIREARLEDASALARLHVECWDETYRGLLPDSEIDARDYEVRLPQWRRMLQEASTRVAFAPDVGFAQSGPQRDKRLSAWPDELLALYTLHSAHGTGLGRALFERVRPERPFTAVVLAGNDRACAFYEKMGGQLIERRPEHIGHASITDLIYGFEGAAK
ncbi:GNAT family N-acetyltransferase [Histidinibacterium aquaticum]|uniref:GNAT family N-acetyltransferase n=1 Tax=Histidinibacterium aquaticum TaxID=2613962 RepID=A0A5J5GFA3_9RHOB|nr:GNAT family N-acetyltransferase [Histidinibacterium aquaticum]KAA9006144.1 GNAT family N-acetyltransferase [Histidinibacterium aquaticum]